MALAAKHLQVFENVEQIITVELEPDSSRGVAWQRGDAEVAFLRAPLPGAARRPEAEGYRKESSGWRMTLSPPLELDGSSQPSVWFLYLGMAVPSCKCIKCSTQVVDAWIGLAVLLSSSRLCCSQSYFLLACSVWNGLPVRHGSFQHHWRAASLRCSTF